MAGWLAGWGQLAVLGLLGLLVCCRTVISKYPNKFKGRGRGACALPYKDPRAAIHLSIVEANGHPMCDLDAVGQEMKERKKWRDLLSLACLAARPSPCPLSHPRDTRRLPCAPTTIAGRLLLLIETPQLAMHDNPLELISTLWLSLMLAHAASR